MTIRKKIAFYTQGCKVNYSETSALSKPFSANGFDIISFKDKADVYVINSCTVTNNADKKCKTAIRQAIKRNPDAIIAVVGCFSQLHSEEIASINGVDIILGNNEKNKLSDYILTYKKNNNKTIIQTTPATDIKEFAPSYSSGDRTRSFLKIQDGCDYLCSYCSIPLARGNSRSDTIANTIKVAREIAATDIREIVLTGVNIGDFGKNNHETFLELLNELNRINGIERMRISSIEPDLLSDELIEFVAKSDKFLPHFHIPLQSGSNTILKAMHRKYDKELFASRVINIKSLMPYCCIATDIIVGFPSETNKDFEDTYNFVEQTAISYVHVFTYSERKNTVASKIEDKIPVQIKHERSKILHELSDKKKAYFYKENIDRKASVLFESDNIKGFMQGFTENYIRVKTKFNANLINKIKSVNLTHIDKDGIFVVT